MDNEKIKIVVVDNDPMIFEGWESRLVFFDLTDRVDLVPIKYDYEKKEELLDSVANLASSDEEAMIVLDGLGGGYQDFVARIRGQGARNRICLMTTNESFKEDAKDLGIEFEMKTCLEDVRSFRRVVFGNNQVK
jgi:hypothetical protein